MLNQEIELEDTKKPIMEYIFRLDRLATDFSN